VSWRQGHAGATSHSQQLTICCHGQQEAVLLLLLAGWVCRWELAELNRHRSNMLLLLKSPCSRCCVAARIDAKC
jgi:hypothetical protein